MRFKTLMVTKTLVSLLFGVAFIFVPADLFRIFGITLVDGATFPAKEYGAALFGNMVVTWFARNAQASDARLAIIRGLFVYDAIGVIVTVLALIAGTINTLGWGVVVIYLFFTLGFGYFMIMPVNNAQIDK